MPGPEQEAAWKRAAEVKAAHEAELLALPGVFAVGIGPKKTDGQWVSEEPAIVVYTTKKQDVPPEQQIPAEIDGVPTDVEEREIPKFLSCPPEEAADYDTGEYSPMPGGVRIQVKDVWVSSGTIETNYHWGTGGCFGYIGTAPLPPLAQRTVVMLTCQHVIVGRCDLREGVENAGQTVGHSTHYHCSYCSRCCTNIFGRAMRLKAQFDTAIIALNKDEKWVAEIRGAHDNGDGTFSNVAVQDSERLTSFPTNYHVRKRGMRTGLTHGTARTNLTSMDLSAGTCGPMHPITIPNMIVIDNATPGVTFSCPGDSGSAVLNDSDKVIGIVSIGGVSTSYAVPIGDIIDYYATIGLTLEIAKATALNDVRTAPEPVGVPPPQEMSAVALGGFGTVPATFVIRLEEVRDELTATDKGREYAAAVERHAHEARELVNKNKRCATVWHRSGGPAIVQAALAAIQNDQARLPETIGDKPFRECVRRIAAIFTRYGSSEFAVDIARFYDDVARAGGMSYRDVKATMA